MNLADNRNISHEQRILAGVDQMAEEDLLGEATTRLIARFSNLSEEVILRHLPDREAILNRWWENRGERLKNILGKAIPGRPGLMSTIRELLSAPELLGMLFCHPGESLPFREALETLRQETKRRFLEHLQEMPSRPKAQTPVDLLETLWQCLNHAWDRHHPEHKRQRKILLDHLPWEGRETGEGPADIFPKPEILQRIALNDSGFVFDPVSGHSFTTNETGLSLLRLFTKRATLEEMVDSICDSYDIQPPEAEKEILDFAGQLREALK